MAFRSPENVQRNELVRFQLESNIRAPANAAEQQKNGYKFVINDRGSFFDWFNAFFEVRFKLDLMSRWASEDHIHTNINSTWRILFSTCLPISLHVFSGIPRGIPCYLNLAE